MNRLYDESAIQSIANAIRTKDGTTSSMLVSEMASKILAIPSGGGGGFDGFIGTSGTFVLQNSWDLLDNPYFVYHGLGKTPSLFVMWIDPPENPSWTNKIPINTVVNCVLFPYSTFYSRDGEDRNRMFNLIIRSNGSTATSSVGNWSYADDPVILTDADKITIGTERITTSNFVLKSGQTYKWIAIAEA